MGLIREENFKKKGLIDFNIDCLKSSLQRLCGGGKDGHSQSLSTTTPSPRGSRGGGSSNGGVDSTSPPLHPPPHK